jgi:hypothetical protein
MVATTAAKLAVELVGVTVVLTAVYSVAKLVVSMAEWKGKYLVALMAAMRVVHWEHSMVAMSVHGMVDM